MSYCCATCEGTGRQAGGSMLAILPVQAALFQARRPLLRFPASAVCECVLR